MNVAIRKMGNSSGLLLPKAVLAHLGIKTGDSISLTLEAGRAVLEPVKRHPRAGWAEDAEKLVALGEAGPVWPEFGNDADNEWEW